MAHHRRVVAPRRVEWSTLGRAFLYLSIYLSPRGGAPSFYILGQGGALHALSYGAGGDGGGGGGGGDRRDW